MAKMSKAEPNDAPNAPLPSSQIVAAPGFPAGERHLPDCAQSRGWENCDCPIGGNGAADDEVELDIADIIALPTAGSA